VRKPIDDPETLSEGLCHGRTYYFLNSPTIGLAPICGKGIANGSDIARSASNPHLFDWVLGRRRTRGIRRWNRQDRWHGRPLSLRVGLRARPCDRGRRIDVGRRASLGCARFVSLGNEARFDTVPHPISIAPAFASIRKSALMQVRRSRRSHRNEIDRGLACKVSGCDSHRIMFALGLHPNRVGAQRA
jgi:hypothetical protein